MINKYIICSSSIHHRNMFLMLLVVFFFTIGMNATGTTVKKVGVPAIQNIERVAYNAGTQNWSVEQGSNGVIYFGNNEGMLLFDGQFWKLLKVPNGSNVRSVYFSNNQQRLFIGAYNELGFFTNDSIGNPDFHSLTHLIPEGDQKFGDVWKIYEGPWGIAFQAFEGIYLYDGVKIEVIRPRSIFHFSFYVNGVFYVFDRESGLMEYRNGFLRKLPGGEFFARLEIWSVLSINADEVLIGTASNGLFLYNGVSVTPWDKPINKLLKEHQIYSSLSIGNEYFAFGTIQNGLVICDKNGNLVQIINREKGLQNNTVLSMKLDMDGNLWLGLDNGIDYVEINSPITLLQDFYDFGTGYISIAYKNRLYMGTNQGLFWCWIDDFIKPDIDASTFKMVKNTSGQVWNLQVLNHQLICGHNSGSYVIDGDIGYLISDVPGSWAYHQVPGYENYFIQGTYNGMELCKFENGKMNHLGNIKGIDYSCQEMLVITDRYIWLSHAFNGVSIFQLTPELDSLILIKTYSTDEGLPSHYLNKVKEMRNGEILLTTTNGIYQYNHNMDNFFKSVYYNNLFHNRSIQYIQEDDYMNVWYVTHENEGGVLRYLEDGSYRDVSFPFNKLRGKFIGSFFHFNVIDDSNVLIALERGFAHYNPKLIIDYRKGFNTALSSVSILNSGEVLYNGVQFGKPEDITTTDYKIDYRNNSLRFSFTGLFFEGSNEMEFSFKLEGFDPIWSNWNTNSVKEYTNLPDGDYVFRVQAKNKYGVISSPEPFKFTILAPWYKTTPAIAGYFILLFVFVWFWVYLFVKKTEIARLKDKEMQKKRFMEREEQLKHEALEAEKVIIKLRNEKLKTDMIHKDKELANTAINLAHKNKELNKLKAELRKIQSELKDEFMRSRMGMIIKKIEKETHNDESWSIFETSFEEVHEDFLKRLRQQHPEISPKELKLAAYLRMNISSKEIAALMNITTRGVEISRYRLRKKLGLDRSHNLTDYILSV
jgi:DNA-binding CsgD family transcriptional regulator